MQYFSTEAMHSVSCEETVTFFSFTVLCSLIVTWCFKQIGKKNKTQNQLVELVIKLLLYLGVFPTVQTPVGVPTRYKINPADERIISYFGFPF